MAFVGAARLSVWVHPPSLPALLFVAPPPSLIVKVFTHKMPPKLKQRRSGEREALIGASRISPLFSPACECSILWLFIAAGSVRVEKRAACNFRQNGSSYQIRRSSYVDRGWRGGNWKGEKSQRGRTISPDNEPDKFLARMRTFTPLLRIEPTPLHELILPFWPQARFD